MPAFFAHHAADLATDVRVHFVEDEQRHFIQVGQHRLSASITRASSPLDAMRLSGSGASPHWVKTKTPRGNRRKARLWQRHDPHLKSAS